jgi:heme-degrading monooxygenase HmoA
MIHAIYRWQVKDGHEEDFITAWTEGTHAIRETVKGSRGSLLLRSHQDPQEFTAIAHWDRLEDWQHFTDAGLPTHAALQRLMAVSQLVSSEVYDEVENLLFPTAVVG